MTPAESELLSRIENFTFDAGEAELSFARRLAKDNGWGMLYAARVIEEYRRFAFMMVAAGHMAVPSDQVDQAWHQHLLYTRSWSDFCKNALRQPLHHEPTKGGADIWPGSDLRFGRDLYFKRVNAKDNVVISRSWLWAFGVAGLAIAVSTLLLWLGG